MHIGKRSWRWYGVALLVVALLFSFFVSHHLLTHALRPSDNIYRSEVTALDTMQRLYPSVKPWLLEVERKRLIQDTTIIAEDGEPLHGIYVRSSQPSERRTALLVHGYKDSAVRMFHLAKMYHKDLGYNLLIPDLRYHGQTHGEYVGMGWADRHDLKRWIAVAHHLFAKPQPHDSAALITSSQLLPPQIVLHGISMGGAATMMLSGERDIPATVSAYIEDCGYSSVWEQFAYRLREEFSLPAFPFLYTASALSSLRYGWTFTEASALEAVKRCQRPMLFIHSTGDSYVPISMVHELYAAKPQPKALWLAPHSAHAMSYHDHAAEYTRRVSTFLQQHM